MQTAAADGGLHAGGARLFGLPVRIPFALGTAALMSVAWLHFGGSPSSALLRALAASPDGELPGDWLSLECDNLWCRSHRWKKVCIHSASLEWAWDSYPSIAFIGVRRTQSCLGKPDFDGPEEVLLRCEGPVVFSSVHPRYTDDTALEQAGELFEDVVHEFRPRTANEAEAPPDGGFCCVHGATDNIALTHVRLGVNDYGFVVSDIGLGSCDLAWDKARARSTCGLGFAPGAEQRSLDFSVEESVVVHSPRHIEPATTCGQRLWGGAAGFLSAMGVVLLFMCIVLSRSNPIG